MPYVKANSFVQAVAEQKVIESAKKLALKALGDKDLIPPEKKVFLKKSKVTSVLLRNPELHIFNYSLTKRPNLTKSQKNAFPTTFTTAIDMIFFLLQMNWMHIPPAYK